MNSRTTNTRVSDSNTIRRGSRRLSTLTAACATALLLTAGVASAGLVLELNPANYNTGTRQWTISAGSMATDYFQCASWNPVSMTTKVYAGDGKSYKAIDFTANGTIMGGPLCPVSLGASNPRTMEAWCFQPTGANGDAQTILCLSRQGGPDNSNFAFVNSMYNRSIWAPPYIEGWDANNSVRAGKWVHLVASYDGTTLNLYVNGVPDKTGIARTFATESGGSMTIGMMRYKGDGPNTTPHSTDNADGWNAWRGWLGSIRVYDSARTAEEVAADYVLGVNYGEVGTSQPKITASVSGGNGTITPSGAVYVVPGNNQTFNFTPSLGYEVSDIVVDGDDTVPLATSYTFTGVTSDHTIEVSFAELPKQWVSGKVTDGTAGILGAKVFFKTSANAADTPTFTTNTVDAAGNYSMLLPPGNWYSTASEVHYFTPADTTYTVAASPVSVPDIVLTANPNWAVLFSLNTDDFSALADGDRIKKWQGFQSYETYNNEAPLLGPAVQIIDGVKWEKNVYSSYVNGPPPIHARADGFNIGTFASGMPAEGVTIVAVVKPEYKAMGGEPRGEIVDIFYGELYLAVKHENGEVMVCTRGYNQRMTGYFIPDGQKTILSLVVKPDGNVELFANGESKWTYSSGADYSSLLWHGTFDKITVGRNGYDGWSTFNGNIGDVYVYRIALDDRTRQTLQGNLAIKFGIPGVPLPPPFGTVIQLF